MKLGFIGTGNMGNPMAQNLLKAGHKLTVYDRNKETCDNLLDMGAIWAESAKAAAKDNEVVFTSLPGPREVEVVSLGEEGILQGITKGSLYVDLSTNSPTVIRYIHQRFQEHGTTVLDAPVSGGTYGAIAGELAVMVGGDELEYARVKPVLDAIGSSVFYCGPIGNGMVSKICNNLMSMGIALLLGETLTMGVKAGVDLGILAEVIGKGSGSNRRLYDRFPRFLFKGNFNPGFALSLAAKDVRLATDLGREFGFSMELSNLVDQMYVEALRRGWGDQDMDKIVALQEDETGVSLRVSE